MGQSHDLGLGRLQSSGSSGPVYGEVWFYLVPESGTLQGRESLKAGLTLVTTPALGRYGAEGFQAVQSDRIHFAEDCGRPLQRRLQTSRVIRPGRALLLSLSMWSTIPLSDAPSHQMG